MENCGSLKDELSIGSLLWEAPSLYAEPGEAIVTLFTFAAPQSIDAPGQPQGVRLFARKPLTFRAIIWKSEYSSFKVCVRPGSQSRQARRQAIKAAYQSPR